MLLRFLEPLIFLVGLYFMWKVARKAWKRADLQDKVEEKVQHEFEFKEKVEEKLHELEVEKEVASKVVVDQNEVEAYRKKLRDLDNL